MVRRNSVSVTPKSLRANNEVCKICWSGLGCLKLGQDNPGSVCEIQGNSVCLQFDDWMF